VVLVCRFSATLLLATMSLCLVVGPAPGAPGDAAGPETVTLVLLHLNDVYEISPLKRGTVGGLARVAALRKQLAREHPYLLTLHAGDFLSPSAIGNAVVDGKRLAGEQMVAVLKAVGIDYIIFGNHEFDPSLKEFEARLDELRRLREIPELKDFPDQAAVRAFNERRRALFSTNVSDLQGRPFPGVPRQRIWEGLDPKTREVRLRVGLIGLTLDTTKPVGNYATFEKPVDAARRQLEEWKKAGEKLDLVIALTHQSLDDDERLARSVPGIDIIVGGHEHENTQRILRSPGPGQQPLPPIFRADANARTVFVHELVYNTRLRRLERIDSKLKLITDAMPEDPEVALVVKHWVDLAYRAFRADGLDPDEELTVLPEDLDGREEMVRNGRTGLTDLVGDAMLAALPEAMVEGRLAAYNAGAIRIDDVLLAGPVTTYDVLRILPFLGDLVDARLKGDVVKRLLDRKDAGAGTGAYLQTRNATRKGDTWLIGSKELELGGTYQVAINDYLLSGREKGLEFLKEIKPGPGGGKIGDWRRLVCDYLRKLKTGRHVGGTPAAPGPGQEVRPR
jgi:5'-nucleotidase